jgi:hypothetical protein
MGVRVVLDRTPVDHSPLTPIAPIGSRRSAMSAALVELSADKSNARSRRTR